MEPGRRTDAIASDTQCTHDKAGFTRIGGPTKALHKRMDAMLGDETECTIRTTANGRNNVEDFPALAFHGSTPQAVSVELIVST